MKRKVSILKLLSAFFVLTVFLISIAIGILSIDNSKREFLAKSEELLTISTKEQQFLVKREVEKAVKEIEKYSNSLYMHPKEIIKQEVQNYYKIASNIYNKYNESSKTKKDIIDIIKIVLKSLNSKPVVSNSKKTDSFIIDMSGTVLLVTKDSKLKNKNIPDFDISNGNLVVKNMINFLKRKKEGFYNCSIPALKDQSNSNSKISYIKLFKPLNFFIGSIFFLDDHISNLKNIILKKIKDIRFGVRSSGYITVITEKGIILTTDEKQSDMIGNNITQLKDNTGKNIYKELLRASYSNNAEGGFATYNWLDPSSNLISKKITYVKRCENFNWIISGGIYSVDIDKDIEELRIALEKKLDDKIFGIIFITLLSILILLIFIHFVNVTLKKDFDSLIIFLKNLISNTEKIDLNSIRFTEIEDIVICANNMLDEKLKSDNDLKESEEKFRTLTNSTNVGVILHRNNEILFVNNVIVEITGFSIQELLKKTFFEIIHNDSKEFIIENFEKKIEGKDFITQYDLKINTKNGKLLWVNIAVNEIEFRKERTYLVSALNITARKEAEELLYRERERLRVTLESIGDGVITTDSNGIIRFINEVASKITGYSQIEAQGRNLIDVFNIYYEKDKRKIINPLKKVKLTKEKTVFTDHPYLLSKKNKEFRISNTTAPIIDKKGKIGGVVIVFRDITEFVEAEDELQKMRKIESLGVLAGGIAHDFNNLLSGMFGNLSVAKLYLAETDNAYTHVKLAEDAMSRATALSNQLLTFSKGGEPVKNVTNIGALVKETADFSLSGSNVKLYSNIEKNLLLAEVDKGQINQVISNLVINGIQSMPDGGNLFLEISNRLKESEDLDFSKDHIVTKFIEESKYKDFIQIKLRDEGCGIDKNSLNKIFDPYFTTKTSGKGLGLASVHSIIVKHKGLIFVEPVKGKGSEFTVLLPASKDLTEQVKKEKENRENKRLKKKFFPEEMKNYKILIMDDELSIRQLLGEMMFILGHNPELCANGEEVISKYKLSIEENRKYDIVFMDLTVPGGSGGEQAIKEIIKIDPTAKVVLASGYSNNAIMANYRDYGFSARMVKPFRIDILRKIIETIGE